MSNINLMKKRNILRLQTIMEMIRDTIMGLEIDNSKEQPNHLKTTILMEDKFINLHLIS